MKKLMVLLVLVVLTFTLSGCNSSNVSSDGKYPEEKILIGVELYSTTDSEILALQDYFDYLAETFNVEFKYSEAIADAEMELAFIEDCAVAGCDAFFAYYNVTGVEQVEKVLEYDMYFWGLAANIEVYEEFKDNPMYLGSIDINDSNYAGGKAMGEWVAEQGFDTVVYANGGADFGVEIFIDRQAGFYDGLGDADVEVVTVRGFPGEQFYADQAAALGTEGLDAVVASFNGVDFWAQPIATAGLEDVKLATFGAVAESFKDAFVNGQLDFLASLNIQAWGLSVPMLINAVQGDAEELKIDGIATKAPSTLWTIDNAEDCEYLFNLQENERVYTAERLKDLIYDYNNDANAELVQTILDEGSIEALLGD